MNVIPVLQLPYAEINLIGLALGAEIGQHISLGIQRMGGRVEIVLIFQHEIDRKTVPASLELVVQNEVGVGESRQEMEFAGSVRVGRVGETLRTVDAGRHRRQAKARGATWPFTRLLYGKARGGEDRVGESPVKKRKRRSAGHESEVQPAGDLAPHGEGVVALGVFVVEQLNSLNGEVFQYRTRQIE